MWTDSNIYSMDEEFWTCKGNGGVSRETVDCYSMKANDWEIFKERIVTKASKLSSEMSKKHPLDLMTWRSCWWSWLSCGGEDRSQMGVSWVNRSWGDGISEKREQWVCSGKARDRYGGNQRGMWLSGTECAIGKVELSWFLKVLIGKRMEEVFWVDSRHHEWVYLGGIMRKLA